MLWKVSMTLHNIVCQRRCKGVKESINDTVSWSVATAGSFTTDKACFSGYEEVYPSIVSERGRETVELVEN